MASLKDIISPILTLLLSLRAMYEFLIGYLNNFLETSFYCIEGIASYIFINKDKLFCSSTTYQM